MSELLTVSARFSWMLYERGDFQIAQFIDASTRKKFAASGNSLPSVPHLLVRLTGQWQERNGKKCFHVEFYDVCEQLDRNGFVAYMQSLKCGCGKIKANAIYDAFGAESWNILSTAPDRLVSDVPGIGTLLAERIVKAFHHTSELRGVMRMFSTANAPVTALQASRFCMEHGNAAADLKNNPYSVCGVHGISFDNADALAKSIGYPPDSPNRVKAYLYKLLYDSQQSGSVCSPALDMIIDCTKRLNVTSDLCKSVIREEIDSGRMFWTNGFVYTAKSHKDECDIAKRLCAGRCIVFDEQSISEALIAYQMAHYPLAIEQLDAVKAVFHSPVSIITGGPGTGKTTVIKAILDVHARLMGPSAKPILLAPTGKAARRMSEATGYEANTVHSAVCYGIPNAPFELIDANLIIVDEASMLDQSVTAELMRRCKLTARIVLVGDPDQLPSVGAGNILEDAIKSSVIPVTRLKMIFRQALENPIVKNAHRINIGRTDLLYDSRQFVFRQTDDKDIAEASVKLYCDMSERYGQDNVILLNPQRNNTTVGVDMINRRIQEYINPKTDSASEIVIHGITFRENDRVIQTRNTPDVKNGETGCIMSIFSVKDADGSDDIAVHIDFGSRIVCYSREQMEDVELAYCLTVHKSQGDEYKHVILNVCTEHWAMLKRNLIYTGITRAKETVVIVGDKAAFEAAIRSTGTTKRNSNLRQRLNKQKGEKNNVNGK